MSLGLIATGAAMSAGLAGLFCRDQRRSRARRGRAFENCRGLLAEAELIREGGDYPSLHGRRDGRRLELRLLCDNVNTRKLPVLWLFVTLRQPLPVGCTLDLLLRPQNTEFYSPHHRLEHRLDLLPGWPEQGSVRCSDAPAGRSLAAQLTPHIGWFEQDAHAKELIVGPGGLRLVYMADQATRSRYLMLRQMTFEHDILDRALAETLVRKALLLGAGLAETAHG